ncbi:MAG TPA: serine/threonine-protein kinase [Aquihabitans sp.]|nr:serine/threonine-protein kinase [Aquihabitans sp.]
MQVEAPGARSDERCPRCGASVAPDAVRCDGCELPRIAPAELPVGAAIGGGRYVVRSVIGRGGFGITYQADDTRLLRAVAIKELFPDNAVRHGSQVLAPAEAREAFRAARDRFLREARVLARFTHPGVVRVYEVFEEHGTAHLVMELLGGRTLVDVLRARGAPFTEEEVLDVAGRVAAALRPVHAAGVLHRDLNPSNVMLTEHGRIVLIDFGLARDYDEERTIGMTRVVTPGYAPLEQYRGEARFGPSTDVYGLAATLYRLATGRVPVAAVARDGGTGLEAVHRINPAISKAVSDAIGDGLELEPGHRPQDLDAFLARLGVRRLPEGPRSVLLGAAGAEAEVLQRAPGAVAPAAAAATPARPLRDPGPARPAPAPDPPRAPADPDRTELVARSSSAPDATVPAGAPVPPVPPVPSGPDATRPAAASVPVGTALLAGAGPVVPAPMAPGARGRAGRSKLTVPLAALAVALGSAAPVLVVGLLVLVALPALATFGDLEVRRLRARHGLASRAARMPTGAYASVRFVRNVVASVLRSSPIVGLGAVLLALWYLVAETALPTGVIDGALRIVGAGTAGALVAASAQGTDRFRTGLAIDRLVEVAVPDGRTTQRVVVGWIVVALVVAAALWLQPDPFPLP